MKKTLQVISLLISLSAAVIYSCKTSKPTETASAPSPEMCAKNPVTYASRMKPVIDAKCGGCHKPGKSAAKHGGVYDTYADIKPHLPHMYHEAIEEKKMPPGLAPKLTAEEIEAWKCWKQNNFAE